MVDRFLSVLFGLSRLQKRMAQVVADAVSLLLSFVLAMVLRTESLAFAAEPRIWAMIALVIAGSIGIFYLLRLYQAMIRYISANAVLSLALGVACAAVLLFAANAAFGSIIPQTVPTIFAVLAFPMVSGTRFGIRALFNRRQNTQKEDVFIYGAGSAGRQLLRTLQQDPSFRPVAFLDDSRQLQRVSVAGLRVFAPQQLPALSKRFGTRRVLLAIPSAHQQTRQKILARLGEWKMHVETIPGISDIMSGSAGVDDLRSVGIEDLLGRDPAPAMDELLDGHLQGKSVMVTGAGGAIGTELCRQALARKPARLVLVENTELGLHAIDAELRLMLGDLDHETEIIPLLMSVQSQDAMTTAMRRFQIETVYHAAAFKHVPLVALNVVESLRNNVFGTLSAANAALAAGVKRFVLISTDKAKHPTSYMGASKRMAELICQAYADRQVTTGFAIVRFASTLGSSGSIFPHFHQQIADGGPVTIPDRTLTRSFMTTQEAALLVLQAGGMAHTGGLFVLDKGDPIAIVDLAVRMISLSGFTPFFLDKATREIRRGEIAIAFAPLRPGEKLCDDPVIGDDLAPTAHPRILSAHAEKLTWPALQSVLSALEMACDTLDLPRIRDALTAAPTGFAPPAEITDQLWAYRDLPDLSSPLYQERMSAAE